MKNYLKALFVALIFSLVFTGGFLNFSEQQVQASYDNPSKALVTTTTTSSQVDVTTYEMYYNKENAQKLYNELSDSSHFSSFGKYAVGLISKNYIGAIAATAFFITDAQALETRRNIKAAIDANSGVKLTRVKTTGRGQYVSFGFVTVSRWDGKRSSIISRPGSVVVTYN